MEHAVNLINELLIMGHDCGNVVEALRDCLSLPTIEAHTFCVQKEEDVLKKCSPLFVHKKYIHFPINLKQDCVHTETEQYKHSPGVPMTLVVSFKRTLQILEVFLMSLIIAGDVEINPGPVDKLTPLNIFAELVELTDLIPFGKELGIPQLELDRIQDDDPNYDSGNVVEALRDCLSLPTIEAPTFCVQKQEDVSRKMSPLFVHKKHRHCPMKLQQNCVHTETEQYKHSPSVNMALVVSFKRTLQILKVLLMLLIIAGDVETNPGPAHKLKPLNLYEELLELTDPVPFGKELGIPQLELDRIQRDHPEDTKEQKMALCQYIVNELHGIDWENIANALRGISMEHLAVKIKQNYCQQAKDGLPQIVPLSGKLMPDRLVKPPAVHGRKPRVRRVRGESKKQQEQDTSGASVSVIKGPPGPSPSSTLPRKTGQLMPGRQVELRTVQDCRKPSNSRAKRVNSGETKNKKRQTSSASVPATMDPPRRSSSNTPSLQGRQVQLPAVEDGRKPSHSRAKKVSGESKKRETSGESVPATMDPPRRSSSSTPSLQAGKLMPNPLVELPAVQPGRKHSLSRANTVSDTPKKKQKLETSDASLPAIIDPPTSSPSGTLSPQAGKLMPNPLVELPAAHGKKHSLSRANTVSDKPKKKQKLETSGASLPASIDPPTSSSSSTVTLQELVKRHHLTDVQLNCEIEQDDIPLLAKYFDMIELYLDLMNLNAAEKEDVVNTLHAKGNQVAMIKCLSLWKGHDSFNATYVALLEVLRRLEKGEIANNVCLYLAAKNESSGALTRDYSLSSDLSESFTSSDHTTGSHQVPHFQFECGCGQCTVYGFITGETCSNHKAFLFPKLEMYGIPSDDIAKIEKKLNQQTTNLHRHFCDLVLKTFSEIEKSVDINKLIVYLKMILKRKWYFPSTSSQIVDCWSDIKSFDDIALYLTKQQYCSWFDYELIEHLRSKYLFTTITSSDSVLDDYIAKFKSYASQRCFIYLHDEGPWPKNQVKVQCKVDSEYNQLSKDLISHLKCVFADILGSPNYHLCFKQVREGCTELVFGAPPYFGEISQLSKYQKSQLKAHGFLKVTIMEKDLLDDSEEVRLKESGSVSSLDNSELGEISSTCSERDNETSDGEEADIDTTDLEYTSTGPGSTVEVTYDLILTNVCESELELQEEMDLDVSPCSLWKALHSGQQCMALKYNGEGDVLNFSKYIEDMQQNKRNVMPSKCVHFDAKLSSHPVILFEVQQPFNDYCFSSEVLSEMQQLSLLLNAAISVLGFSSSITLQMTTESLFVHKTSTDDITSTDDTKAMFLPMYEHSYFHQLVPKTQPELPSLNWLKDTLLLMVHRKQLCNSNYKLSENHILFNIFKHRWFPDDKPGYSSTADVAKELQHILELEKTRLEMIDTLADSEYLEVPHLHMLLIGHTGVGKTSIRKHLQNIPFNDKEKSTIIMKQELLYQETFESTIDSKKSTVVFKKYDSVYKSDPDKIYLTLWDTGGQPMFQDLLPCFAKFRSIYGIVVRLCDLLDNSNACIRPTCPLEIERESPYTSTDYLYRCLSFLDSTSLDVHLGNLPDILKKKVFEVASGTVFPKIAFIGTFKDQIKIDDKQDLDQMLLQLKVNLNSLGMNFRKKVIFPSTSTVNSVMFEIDNTQSGAKYDDPGMKTLREQIVSCTKSAKAKIPSKWISFKIDLERESRLQQPCTGIVTFEKASEIAKRYKTDLRAALCYFHELGIFIWYHDKKNLQEYVFIEPKNLLSILGTILDPQVYIDLPKQWKQLQAQGILNVQVCERLLADSKTGLPLSWILSFFEEHHLAMPLLEGYFIPSMLQVLPVCPNHQHVFDANNSACSVLSADLKVAPLFLVPKSKFVPPGFFPRLMTVLSGIKEGSIIWKLSPDVINCKNMLSFEINNQFRLVFTEFIDCVRAHFDRLTDDNIPHRDLCIQIVSTLMVQLQRVINTQSVRLTFSCSCSEHSSSIHFLKDLPFAADDHVPCGEHAGKQMELTAAHKIWLSDEHHPKIATLKDAEFRFEAAMKGNKFGLRFTTILFTGLPGSDVYACKQLIMDKNFTPLESVTLESQHPLDPIKSEPANYSYYTVGGDTFKPLHDEDLDTMFACNAAIQTPKGENVKYDKNSTLQQGHTITPIDNLETNLSNQSMKEMSAQSVDKKVEVPRSTPFEDFPQHLTSNHILMYEPIPKESLLKCVSSENILQLMVNRDRSLRTNLDIITCVCCSDIWLLDVLPIFLQGITIGINCMSLRQNEKLYQKTELEGEIKFWEVIRADRGSKQLIKDISVLATKLMVIGNFNFTEVECIKTNESNSEILFRGNGQEEIITIADEKYKVYILLEETENIKRQLVSSLALSELKQVSLSWHMLGHAIKKVMQQYNKSFISKQEVLIIATAEFRLSITDIEMALLNLHMSGLILYFGNVLPNVIFNNSTVLIELMAQINLFTMQHNQGAIIPFTAFEACEEMYAGGLFTCKEAISLLKDLHILIELENSLFLMPCLLREEISVETFSVVFGPNDTKVAPLVIQCSIARGSFEYIMCYLCSQYNGHPWPWKINAPKFRVFKNCVQFILPGLNVLITLYRQEDAAMTVYVNSMQDHEILPSIRAAIVNGLNKAAEAFHISGQALPVVGFHCTCDQDDSTHMIVPSTEGHWRCSATNEIIVLSFAQNVWFTKIHNGADAVTVHNVFAELVAWSTSWYKIGSLFNLESDVLETITVQYRQDTDTALMEVIRKWFHTHHNPSWEEVQPVFSNLKQFFRSEEFERLYITEDVFKRYFPDLMLYVSLSTLLPYLLKYRLVLAADVDSVQSLYLDNSTKITNLLNLTKRNGGENPFHLLYDCLCESSEEHAGHEQIVEELKICVRSSSIIVLDSSQIEFQEHDTVESVDALIREVSDHIGRDWTVLARSLNFTETDIESIEYAKDPKEQTYQFFYQWKQREGQEATRDKLYAALHDSELKFNELLKKLEKTDVKRSKQNNFTEAPVGESSGALTQESLSSYLRDSILHFRVECGCGQCSINDFIAGETCPNPKATKLVSGSPFDDNEIKLQQETIKLHRSFCELVLDTFSEMKAISVDIHEVIDYLKLCNLYFQPTSSVAIDFWDDFETFDDIGVHLMKQQYCSWFDYELIEDLRNKYLFPTITSSDSVLDDYKAKFKTYASQRCFIDRHDGSPWPIDEVSKVILKVDFKYDQLSLNVIKRFQRIYANIIGIPIYNLHLRDIRTGCTELVFGAPPYFGEISQLSVYQKSQLKAHGFLKVTIMEQDFLEVDSEEVRLKDSGSLSSLDNSELGEISSTCSEADKERSDGEEADIDTTNLEYTSTDPGLKVEVAYDQILNTICESELELQEEMDLDVSPCSLWKALHNLEKTRIEMIDTLADSEYLEVPHLHMLLIGHTGVGKTSVRKHLQNMPFNDKEKSTIIMEQELLYQETFESTVDSNKSTVLINLFTMQHNQGAIIPFTAFEVCEEMYAGGLFTCKQAISLFKDLHILIELGNSLFLMPCLLREEVSLETFSSVFSPNDTKVAPLVIQCSLACGCFEYIMCYLCSQYNDHPWPWKIITPHSLVFKNFVQIVLPGVNSLITLYKNDDAEMTVYVNSMDEVLPSIKTAIVNGLSKAAEPFHISGQAPTCTYDHDDNTHMIVPSTDGHWRCSATNEINALSSAQNIWFSMMYCADTIIVHNVFAELVPWSNSWYKVRMLFNLKIDVLETITVQRCQDTDAALMEVIRKWLHTHHNPSWEGVQQVVSTSLIQNADELQGGQGCYLTEDVFEECLPYLMLFVSISTLLPYLLTYRLVSAADVDSLRSPYIDNSAKMINLLNLTKRNGGLNGFRFLYDCLSESSEKHVEHKQIIEELKRCVISSAEILERASWIQDSEIFIQHSTKLCRVPIEKSGRSMDMTCGMAACRYEWCWICQVGWSRQCQAMATHWFG